ncbi:MAG TPA: Zn-ribbon domain-containing OB-fold protein [Dehalococcoidia bacterium]|nr:Zn-ribbon domain-containing OB-fold protein [Dehalococcoidia bacterium]
MGPEASTEAPRRVPIRGAHLRLPAGPDEEPALEGSRCPQCGDTFYPPRVVCLNCYHEGMERVALSRHGTLWTFTIARMAIPGSLVSAPYVIAQVELPEGVMVATVLTGVDPEAVRIGMALELVVEKASVNAEGAEVMTFKFRPAEGGPA